MPRPVTQKEFVSALLAIGSLPDTYKTFLRSHCEMPGRASTATMLAEKAGYKSWRTLNLQYGRLANRIARQLGRPQNGMEILVDFSRPQSVTNEHWLLIMRPDFERALSVSNVLT